MKNNLQNLSDEQRRKILAAAEIVDGGDMAVVKKIIEFDNTIETVTEKVDGIEKKVEETITTAKQEIETIKQDVATKLSEVQDGKTPTEDELKSIILPLIPKVKDGKTPTKKELISLIEPLIPTPLDGKDANPEDVVPLVIKKLPSITLDNRQKIVEKINSGKKNDLKIQASQIEGLLLKSELDRAIGILDKRTQFLINKPTGTSGGSTSFIGLTDVPSTYAGSALKVLRVNAGETALEFTTLAGGGDALKADPLSQFASTTSAQLAGVISDETGSGALVFATSPTLVTPVLGVATATSINKVTITAPATGSTLTIDDGFTLHVTGDVTALSGSHTGTSSGTNTGDQTSVSGNAGTATALQNARTIGGVSFDGTANITVASATGGFAVSGGALTIGSGSVGSPSLTFVGDTDNGMYYLGTNNYAFSVGGNKILDISTTAISITPIARTSGASSYFSITTPADTGITANTESKGINIIGGTRTWTDGTVTTQREYFFGKPTYNKTTTSATFTDAYTLYIEGSPTAGTGVTITNPWALGVGGNIYQSGAYTRLGNATPNNTFYAGGSPLAELWGTNNTTSGVQMGVGNTSNGTSAYSFYFLNNDLAVSNDSTHYAGMGLNSSGYNDNTFGTGANIANQFQLWNTDGPMAFIASKNGATGYFNWLVRGSATTNEMMRLTSTELTIGLAGTTTGKIRFAGATSNYIDVVGVAVGGSTTNTLQAVTDTFVYRATTDTLTNKTLIATSNVVEEITTTASSSTPTPTGGSLRNFFTITALAAGATFAAPSGTPANGNYLTIRILDNGTARSLAWNSIYRDGYTGYVTLPTTTILGKTMYVGFRYNSADSKWDLVSVQVMN